MLNNSVISVTGMSVISSLGDSLDAFWSNCVKGVSGISQIESFDTRLFKCAIAGEINDFDPEKFMQKSVSRRADRFAQLGIAAGVRALEDAGVRIDESNADRIGIVIGSGLGGNLFHESAIYQLIYGGGPKMVMPSSVAKITPNSVSSWIAIITGIRGPNYTISTACSSSANAIGLGAMLINSGVIDVCLVGGAEAPITPTTVAAYQSMGVLDPGEDRAISAPRPFDKNRRGMVLAEGSACLVLERKFEKNSQKKQYGILAGYASNCGAYNMTTPDPSARDAVSAMERAIQLAGLSIDNIDYINAHGTGTLQNDLVETKAIKKVFGAQSSKIPISSIKSMIGHSIGAAGAIEAVASLMTIKTGLVPPTINLTTPDPDCDLDYVPNTYRQLSVRNVISNSFGFGSNNSVLVFSEIDSSQ